jgi:putative protein-disulfide isomerase
MSSSLVTLYYIHDPMCSWCWAYRPTLLQLRENLPATIRWQNVLGGLAPDSDQPMPDETRNMVQGHWRNIQSTVGTEFNFDFWIKSQPRRDTYKACRAVIAASWQGAEEAMIEAIQKAYYLRAMNPSDPEILGDLAEELELNYSGFMQDLVSAELEAEFQDHLSLRRQLNVRSFPSLVLTCDSQRILIGHDYHDHRTSLAEIMGFLKTAS